jgi:CRISPR/Cas system CMR-associated protein Cmr5 small subunit
MPNITVKKDQLDFLRKKIKEKYESYSTNAPLVINSYPKNYAYLADAISSFANEKDNYVSDRQLAKFFFETANDATVVFREEFINLCYLYISEGQLDMKSYQKLMLQKDSTQGAFNEEKPIVQQSHFSKYKFFYAAATLVVLAFISPYLVEFSKIYFSKSDVPIISNNNQLLLDDAIEKLEDFAKDDWRKRDMDCWNTAELFLSMRKDASDTSNFFLFEKSITTHYDSIFPGWKSTPAIRKVHPTDMRATAWVLLIENTIAATIRYPNLIDKILNEQSSEGAWTTFEVKDAALRKEYASTYSTCFTMLLLNKIGQKTNDSILKQRISDAIDHSKSWLIKARMEENGNPISQWKDYPYQRSGKRSKAISAWAIHTLNQISYSKVKEINQNWMANDPSNSSNVFDSEDCDVDYPNRAYNERTKVLTNTATIVAACDVYATSTLSKKLKINTLINEFVEKTSQTNFTKLPDDSYVFDFRRADLLVALKYLKGNKLL